MTHTPLPWERRLSAMGRPFIINPKAPLAKDQDDIHGKCIAQVSGLGNANEQEQRDNAAFIVRAVNCHDDLLAALEELYMALHGRVHSNRALRALAQAETALAKAKGG